jgi:hypothetical protein
LKTEWKAHDDLLSEAKQSLVNKFHDKAIMVFPRRDRRIVGLIGCPRRVELFVITFDPSTNTFITGTAVKVYLMAELRARIEFVVDLFKVCRWIATIDGPVGDFHLVPDVRMKTRNHHHVTWVPEGILKEFNGTVSEASLERMDYVIQKHLDYVEWGTRVPHSSSVIISSIGIMAKRVLSNIKDASRRTAMRDKMIREVQAGLDSLHSMQLAHCDICLDNVFFEEPTAAFVEGRFFLDDLEYITPLDGVIPNKNLRLPVGCTIPDSPLKLDELNYGAFVVEAYHY